MTWLGVPVLDWVLLVFVLGLGVEAWLTTRARPDDASAKPSSTASSDPEDHPR